jgi:hypothetical protein
MTAFSKEKLNKEALRVADEIYPGFALVCQEAYAMVDSMHVYPSGDDLIGTRESMWGCDYRVGVGWPVESNLVRLVPFTIEDVTTLDEMLVYPMIFDNTRVRTKGNLVSINDGDSIVNSVDLEIADPANLTEAERLAIAIALIMPKKDRAKSANGIIFTEPVDSGPIPSMGYKLTRHLFLPNEAGYLVEVGFDNEGEVKDLLGLNKYRIGVLVVKESINQTLNR